MIRTSSSTYLRQKEAAMRSPEIPDRNILLNDLNKAAESVSERICTDDNAFDHRLKKLFKRCFMDTAERTLLLPGMETVDAAGNTHTVTDEVFIITGDINAMWLRDSSAQVSHYLPFAGRYSSVAGLAASLIRRQQLCILRDPYANAYLEWPGAVSEWVNDRCGMVPGDWERKYETDSLSYHILLVKKYISGTGDTSMLGKLTGEVFERIISVWETETDHENASPYTFERTRSNGKYAGLARNGRGTPLNLSGMTWSGFRPSDDPCEYGLNIPENLFAASALRYLEDLSGYYPELAVRAHRLREGIEEGIRRYGTVMHPDLGRIYAYETDGLGNHILMDDPNVPGLLSLPYLGICAADDELYLNTRRFILSPYNRWYYRGSAACGIGSPHTPEGYIWPIGLIIQGMTSPDRGEQTELLRTLVNTDASCLAMHESFDVNDPSNYTRSWFAWADSLFSEYVMNLFPEN